MSRPQKLALPLREGVSASALACPNGPWYLVLDFLAERLPLVSREEWKRRMAAGEIFGEEGLALTASAPFRAQTRIYYYRQLAHEDPIPLQERIVFQDAHLLVADKPHFLPVTPKGRYVQQTLLTRLKRSTGLADLTPVHRLDRDTAGLCVFAVRAEDRDAYQRLFREREVEKVYEAIAPHQRHRQWPVRYRSRLEERSDAFMQMHEVPGVPNAETHITLLECLDGDWARYELRPLTGRKHQLRAQMNGLGLPLKNDRIYPMLLPEETVPDYSHPLQLLAKRLAFIDPLTGKQRVFESGLSLDRGA